MQWRLYLLFVITEAEWEVSYFPSIVLEGVFFSLSTAGQLPVCLEEMIKK